MAKKGAALEQLVALIQEVLKDRQNVSIKTNEKVVDTSGINREIDVLVSTKVQGMPFQIAFECKDYSKKQVDIQIVDAMIGKYKYLPQIQKKVLVSSSGYTENAIKRAKDECIEACSMENMPLDTILTNTKTFDPIIKIEFCEGSITFYDQEKVNKDSIDCYDCYLTESDTLYDFEKEILHGIAKKYSNLALVTTFMQNGAKPFRLNTKTHFGPDVLYLNDKEGNKISVEEVIIPVMIRVEMDEGEIIKQQRFIQGKEVFITESRFKNERPFTPVIIDAGEKWGTAIKKNGQYEIPKIQIEC